MEYIKRKPNRLKNYDYGQSGAYFITLCIKNRYELLWNSFDCTYDNNQHLSEYGIIVDKAIKNISLYYSNVYIDKYVVMPNHIHIIVIIDKFKECYNNSLIITSTISTIIGQMKRWVSKEIGFSIWQKSFHDHIIRNEREYQIIWKYIDTNPVKWEEDCFYVIF